MFNGFDNSLGMIDFSIGNNISTGQNSLNWNNIINQGFAIGSQLIGAFGRNPTQQIGYNQSQGIFAIGQPTQVSYQQNNPYANMSPTQIQAYQQASIGGGVGSGIDSTIAWATKNPLLVFGGIAAVFLLFREPPRRR